MDSQGNPETAEEVVKVRGEIAKELSGEEPTTVVDPATLVTAKEQEVNAEEHSADPWEGVNPGVKQMFDDLSSKVSQIVEANPLERLKQAERRIGSITQEVQAAKQVAKEVVTAPTAEQIAAAAKTDEQWDSLKKDFPEWAEAIDGRLSKTVAEELQKLRTELGGGTEKEAALVQKLDSLQAQLESGVPAQVQKGLVEFFHAGWTEVVKTPEFTEWKSKQPADVLALCKSDLAGDAVAVLDMFKESRGKTKTAEEIAAERRQRLSLSNLPRGAKATRAKGDDELSEAELRSKIGREVYSS